MPQNKNNILFSNSCSLHHPPIFCASFVLIMIVIDCTQRGLSFFIIFRSPTSLFFTLSHQNHFSVPSVRREFARHRITRCSESLYFTSHPNVLRFALFESSQPRPVLPFGRRTQLITSKLQNKKTKGNGTPSVPPQGSKFSAASDIFGYPTKGSQRRPHFRVSPQHRFFNCSGRIYCLSLHQSAVRLVHTLHQQ